MTTMIVGNDTMTRRVGIMTVIIIDVVTYADDGADDQLPRFTVSSMCVSRSTIQSKDGTSPKIMSVMAL